MRGYCAIITSAMEAGRYAAKASEEERRDWKRRRTKENDEVLFSALKRLSKYLHQPNLIHSPNQAVSHTQLNGENQIARAASRQSTV
jgi:hypothetical protein